MKSQTLRTLASRVHPLQSLVVTFAEGIDGIRMLSVLNGYCDQGQARFQDKVLALAVLASQDWNRTGRKLIINLHPTVWIDEGFLRLAERGIEQIRVGSDSPLNALQSGRQKKREEAYKLIAESVLTQEVVDEIQGWGFTVRHDLIENEGCYMVAIVVQNGTEIAFSLFLDAWSGNIMTPDLDVICFCSRYQTAKEQLKALLEHCVEQMTT